MKFQLQYSDGKNITVVREAEDLPELSAANDWATLLIQKENLKVPEGSQWLLVDENAETFQKSKLTTLAVIDPTFEEVMKFQQEQWEIERLEKLSYDERLQAHMATFKG